MRYEDCTGGIEAKGSANVKSVIRALRCDQSANERARIQAREGRHGSPLWISPSKNSTRLRLPFLCFACDFLSPKRASDTLLYTHFDPHPIDHTHTLSSLFAFLVFYLFLFVFFVFFFTIHPLFSHLCILIDLLKLDLRP
jgi:hypothetical protein